MLHATAEYCRLVNYSVPSHPIMVEEQEQQHKYRMHKAPHNVCKFLGSVVMMLEETAKDE